MGRERKSKRERNENKLGVVIEERRIWKELKLGGYGGEEDSEGLEEGEDNQNIQYENFKLKKKNSIFLSNK